ncbi:MAG: hypothetical protein QOH47_1898 [Sphingomonadales bacterium]|nr:hypothetical protein [Sphingomonadales bacterium]
MMLILSTGAAITGRARLCYTSPMTYLLVKALLSGLIVAAASEVARRWPGVGGLIVSLPLVSLLAFIWLWRDTGDTERVVQLAQSAFWFFLPSMPLFLVLPPMLRAGWGFWPSLGLAVALTACLYLLMLGLAPRFGLRL